MDSGAIAVEDEHIMACRDQIARQQGLLLCPEGAATCAAYEQALGSGLVSQNDQAVLFNCATGLKYPMPEVTQGLDQTQSIDYTRWA